MPRSTPSLALIPFNSDAFSLCTESDCPEACLARYDLLMFTFQKTSFQDKGPDLAVLDPQVLVRPKGWGPVLASSCCTHSKHEGTETNTGETAVIETSRPSGANCYRVVVWLLGLLLQIVVTSCNCDF